MPLYRPVRAGFQQPVRMFVKHLVNFQITRTWTMGGYSLFSVAIHPLQGNDVFGSSVSGTRPFPSNWETYSRIYSHVRIHGIKITATLTSMQNDANDDNFSVFYSTPGPNDGTTPTDPYSVTTATNVDQFLGVKGLRKNRLLGAGTQKSTKVAVHNAGYWSIKRIQSELSTDAHIAELEVNSDGTSANDPEIVPTIFHKFVTNNNTGRPAGDTVHIRYIIILYADW